MNVSYKIVCSRIDALLECIEFQINKLINTIDLSS